MPFTYTENFVAHVIQVFANGGVLEVKPIFELSTLISELERDLLSLGIPINASALTSHGHELEKTLTDLLDGVSLELRNPKVQSCTFEKLSDKGHEFLGFVIETTGLPGGVINVPSNVKLVFSVFGSVTASL